ncbi:MAG: SurA N-terminal domain-containing protein [Nitrospirae bacterium]|nr:SurA N-terminal domain-containing protein [Nitrospirota bacterium]
MRTIIACLMFLVLAGTGRAAESSAAGGKKDSDPIAKVNNTPITVKMLKQAIEERIPATGHRSLSQNRLFEIRQEELNKLIVRELIYQEAIRLGIKVESNEVEAEFSRIAGRFPSEKQFKENLDRQGLTPSDVREGLGRYLMIRKVTEQEVRSKIVLTDDELKTYYDGHREQFVIPDAIRLRMILIKVEPGGSEPDWEEGRKKAQGLADRIRAGEDAASLAAEFSEDDETKVNGGDTGLLHQGRLPFTDMEEAAFSRKVGDVVDPVRLLQGYVVFKIEEKRPSKPLSYEEVDKELLRREMKTSAIEKRFAEWAAGLKTKAEIKIY